MDKEYKLENSFEYKGKKCVIVWVGSHYCSYVETSLTNVRYNDESLGGYEYSPESMVSCHGGITFGASPLDISPFDKTIQFFGMDFAHSGDYVECGISFGREEHRWTLEEVEEETKNFADSLIGYENIYPKIKELYKEFENKIKELE
jgi:hypothetical protein